MTPTTTPRIVSLTLAQIVPHPRNVRHELTDLAALAASIKQDGILQPLVVAPGDTAGTFVLIAGHRRHAAAGKAGLKELPCLVRDDLTDKADQLQAMLTENLQRSNLNPIEEGDAFQELLDLGIKPAILAKRTGRTAKLIRARVKIASAPEELRNRVIAREVTLDEALILEGFTKYPEVYDQLAQYIGTANWSWAVARAKENAARAATLIKLTNELTSQGVQILDDAGLEEHRLRAEAVGLNRVWQDLAERPDDAASEDVAVTFPYRNPENMQWKRLVDAATTAAAKSTKSKKTAGKTDSSSTTSTTDADRARVEADIAAANQLAADLKTAAPVRRAHLKNSIAEADTDLAAECLRLMLVEQIEFLDADEVLILGEIAFDSFDPDTASTSTWEMWTYTLNLKELAVVLRIVDKIGFEENLEQLTGWQHRSYLGKSAAPWRDELGTTFGYEWSDVEADLLTQFAADATAADEN